MNTIQRTYKHQRNLKLFLDKARGDLIKDIDETKSLIVQAIKMAIKANMRPESTAADKARARLDSFRDTLKQKDPILNVFTKEEKKMLKEKNRLKSVVLFIELLLCEIKYLKNRATDLLWTAKNLGNKGRDQFTIIVDDVQSKILVYERTIGMFEGFITTSLGREKLGELKKQLLEFFDKKELDHVVRLVRFLKFRKLEQYYLADDDLIIPGVDARWKTDFDNVVADEPAEPAEGEEADVIDNEAGDLLLHAEERESLPREPEPLKERKKMPSSKETSVPPESIPVEDADDAGTDDIAGTPNISHFEAFLRMMTGKSVYDDEIRSFIIEQGQQIKNSGENSAPLARLYEEIMQLHPDWKITPKQFLHAAKDLEKYGIISKLERLDTGYYMIQFLPVELTSDPESVLQLSKEHACMTKNEIMNALEWPEYRTDEALNFLQEKGFMKTDTSYMEGTRYFFMGNSASN
ncbi:MAG TPA: hypothetical protein VKM55_14455 [Candidatus Lokiarchaeia archaeon]|nr:hypothetical protein [Candidatus Lokiarchaeia archaeon]